MGATDDHRETDERGTSAVRLAARPDWLSALALHIHSLLAVNVDEACLGQGESNIASERQVSNIH